MPKLTLCCGISTSGKSTWAKEVVDWETTVEINRDTVRFNLFCNGIEDWSLYKFTKAREQGVSQLCDWKWYEAVKYNQNVIVSDTNLKQKYHDHWRERALAAGYEFEVRYFPISLEEAWKRDERRLNSVGRDVITRQWKDWLEITHQRKYVADDDKQPCIVLDVDGTLAEMHNRGPFEWSKVGQDKPRRHVIDIVEAYVHRYPSVEVVVVSGRDGSCEQETRNWLIDNGIFFDCLFMRKAGDSRKDAIIKEDILFDCIAPAYNILFWVDDRPQVVRKIKDLGINVIDVSKSYEEF